MGNEEHGVCPLFHHAIEVVGRRWSGAIIMLLVQRGTSRFNELLAGIPGISDRLLSERLRELESEDVVVRTVEPGPPVRVTYALSESGRALEPAIVALASWAERWIAPERLKTSA